MGLKKYKEKRDFEETPEPKPLKGKKTKELKFCVQKHDASHLHYDFRLEHHGVLLSWAVPKGPSMNPKDKRLAIHVEDHPLDYLTFHGVIPKGNYGAGTVELWDIGTYTPTYSIDEGLKKGHLQFELQGKKLHGTFDLVQLKGKDEKQWLLIKNKDDEKIPPLAEKKKSKMPHWIAPMLCKLIDEPFSDPNWIYEVKLDGYRALAFVDGKQVDLLSRNQNSFNKNYPEIVQELKKLNIRAIFDGEVVSLDKEGRSKFEYLKNYQSEEEGTLCYYIFDLLYYDGRDLRDLQLIERKAILKELLDSVDSDILRYSDHIEEKGIQFFKQAKKNKLEGIIAKKKDSLYQSTRSSDWLKIKTSESQEVVIAGFTQPKGSREKFGALLLGVYKRGKLKYIGHVGTGFNQKSLKEIHAKLTPLIQPSCPFEEVPKTKNKPTWVKPKLLADVSFTEWTKDGRIRHPVFHGLRTDKNAKEVVKEVPMEKKPDESNDEFTNLDKLYWKKEKITKGDIIEYYRTVAPFILPYLKNHPLMLHRYPNGINGSSFYQKNIQYSPPFVQLASIKHSDKVVNYVLVQDEKTLLWVANLGSIELHPMIMEVDHLQNPSFLVVDLDPEDMPFKTMVEIAQSIHKFFDSLKIPNYCKTSGGRGLHIYIPLHAKYTFEQTEQFAELLANIVQKQHPDIISLERRPAKRQKKIYFDFLQNLHGGRTMVAPYSLRARPHAPVSTPLKWSEVNAKLDPLKFNIKTIPKRLKKVGDLFHPTLIESIDLKSVLKRLEKYL